MFTEVNREIKATDVSVYYLIFKLSCSGRMQILKHMIGRKRRRMCITVMALQCSRVPGVGAWNHDVNGFSKKDFIEKFPDNKGYF